MHTFQNTVTIAERTGAVLLTAFGYDYVPGNWPGLSRSRPPDPPQRGYRSATSCAGVSGGEQARAPAHRSPACCSNLGTLSAAAAS
jgi:hypothetical protein